MDEIDVVRKHDVVRGVKELVDSGTILHHVPANYIRPPHDRPSLSPSGHHVQQLPVISLSGYDLLDNRRKIVEEIGRACEEWGFFQVTDHGIPRHVCERMWEAGRRFFDMPAEERMRLYTTNFKDPVGYWTSFNPDKETVLEWKDSLILNRSSDFEFDGFEQAPEIIREPLLEYMDAIRGLAGKLWKAILESLELDAELLQGELQDIMVKEVAAISYYAPCPDPSLTFGLSSHSDIGILTILKQDIEVRGLQVRKDDTWLTVNPLPDSFVVNVGDQVQILTNGKYKSAEHRVVTNSEKPRMSIPCFFQPKNDATIAPLPKLVNQHNPALYKEITFADFVNNVYSKALKSKSNLDFAKVDATAASC